MLNLFAKLLSTTMVSKTAFEHSEIKVCPLRTKLQGPGQKGFQPQLWSVIKAVVTATRTHLTFCTLQLHYYKCGEHSCSPKFAQLPLLHSPIKVKEFPNNMQFQNTNQMSHWKRVKCIQNKTKTSNYIFLQMEILVRLQLSLRPFHDHDLFKIFILLRSAPIIPVV